MSRNGSALRCKPAASAPGTRFPPNPWRPAALDACHLFEEWLEDSSHKARLLPLVAALAEALDSVVQEFLHGPEQD